MSGSGPAKQIPNGMRLVLGGAAAMTSICIVQPLDLIKTRMQISGIGGATKEYKNTFHCLKTIIRKEGPLAVYNGLGAAIFRQGTYGTTRLGLYSILNNKYKLRYGEPNYAVRLGMGVLVGICGAFVGTPADVVLIRMTADGRLPPNQRRNYKNVFNGFSRIIREEGILTLWRGCVPTLGRAIVVNMAQLATYSEAKSQFIKRFEMKENIQLHFYAALVSGLFATIVSMPVDIAKTRMQNMKYIRGKPEYRGMIDVLVRIVKNEGVFALWKGFTPNYSRLAPHTVLTFVFLEKLNQAYYKYVLGTTGGSGL